MEPPDRIEPGSLRDYVAVMAKVVFQSGLAWHVVEAKWSGIRETLGDFDPAWLASRTRRQVARLSEDPRVIRNPRKLAAIVQNTRRIIELDREHGSFRDYLRAGTSYDDNVERLRRDFTFLGEVGSYLFLYVVGESVPPYQEWTASRQQGREEGTRSATR